MTGKWLCLPVALCVLSLGCGGKKPEPAEKGVSSAARPTAPDAGPTAAAEAPKGIVVTRFRLGSSAGPDGVVGNETRTFGAGEAVFASFEVANAPAGSKARAVWALLPDKKPVSRQEVSVSSDKPAVAFKADTKGWSIGEYELETVLVETSREDFLGTAQFKLVKDKPK